VREAEHDLADGATRIIALATETAGSIFAMGSYADSDPRLLGLTWGAEDLSADLGAEANRLASGDYTDPYRLARSLAVFAAAHAGIAAIDTVYPNFRDLDGFRAETEAGRRDGFTARMAIHPAQVPIINEVFTPSAAAVAHAHAVVAAFTDNPEAGVVAIDGAMVDRPHLRQAERILSRAAAVKP
jgi:citrate lyase subunit beta/citryl-CoA lyase